MSNSKYRVGDRVEYIGKYNGPNHMTGLQGFVIKVDDEGDVVVKPLVPVEGMTNLTPMWAAENIRKLSPSVPEVRGVLPEDSAERKTYPLLSGLFDYFPSALAAVAHHSYVGNEKHNPGQKMQHARGKSGDHLDCALRHIMERDLEGAAWRVLAALQEQLEQDGAPVAPAATFGDNA